MRVGRRPAAVSFVVALLVPTLAPAPIAPYAAPAVSVAHFDAGGLLPLTVLAKLSAQAGVPMGVEWVGPGEGSAVKREWHNASVALIAQQILDSQNRGWAYSARWDQGTLVLRPVGRKLGGHSALDVRLPHFDLTGQRPIVASRMLADAIGRYLLGQPPPETFVWTGGFNLDVPVVSLTRSFANEPAYRVLDWMAAAGAESFWLVQDLPKCRIGGTHVWCTYTYFGTFRKPTRQPAWALLRWRADPMNVVDPAIVGDWRCAKCPAKPKPPGR